MRTKQTDSKLAKAGWEKLPSVLADMGYDSLRPAQKDCLESILKGEDTFCILPTGGGKTLLAAIPAMVFDWPVVIFSPLVALMRDQAQSLNRKGVRAGAISSGQVEVENAMEVQQWINGDTRVLLVAPERMENQQFMGAMQLRKPKMVVVDEAHCVSQWAATFRPNYQRIGKFIETVNPRLVVAMTATATSQIVEDVKRILGTPEIVMQKHYYPRENLHLSSRRCESEEQMRRQLLDVINGVNGSVLVYSATVRHITEIVPFLLDHGVDATFFHGQMTNATQKAVNQDAFMENRTKVMVATNAFGMGIDKQDIAAVIHLDLPGSLEAIAQETGRAARDGRDATCLLFDTPDGRSAQEALFDMSNPSADTVRFVYNYFQQTMNDRGTSYATLEELKTASGEASASAAVTALVSMGVIGRSDPPQIGRISGVEGLATIGGMRGEVLRAAISVGVDVPNTKYVEFSIEAVAKRVGTTASNVKKYLNDLRKQGVIEYEPPRRSKATTILRDLTQEDLQIVEYRRNTEIKKLKQVRAYAEAPDEEKQKILTDFFASV